MTRIPGGVGTLTLLTLQALSDATAQSKLPVIHATSKVVDVADGHDVRKGAWYIFPERKPDVYYVSVPRRPHRVTFRTDKDSIAFDIQYGESYDFIILLNGRDTCLTRIVARERELLPHTSERSSMAQTSDTIPITVGDDNRIRFAARINGSQPLNFQFDLGAGGSILKKGSTKKVAMIFDGKATLINSNGQNEVPTSSRNTLKVGPMTWSGNVGFSVADNLERDEDGLVGNSLFMDSVIEIDYDKLILVVHDRLPAMSPGYTRQSVIFDGVIPFVKASIVVGADTLTDWYMFDTGNKGLVRLSKTTAETRKLGDKLRTAFNPFKKTYVFPQFRIGSHSFSDVKGVVHDLGPVNRFGGLIGNALLKRYNVILDNRNGDIYLRPNGLMATSFD